MTRDGATRHARLVRTLADAIVRELRAEKAIQNESPLAGQGDTGSCADGRAPNDDTTDRLRQAS